MTEKVFESDSTDASDNELTVKKNQPEGVAGDSFPKNAQPKTMAAAVKKPATSAKTASKAKQSNLMSFFKK